ncbi:MAG: N-acetyltransferase [Rhodothermales bacterium]
MTIRPETPSDHAAVFALNATAFPTDAEARLVDALRKQASPIVSLVAEQDGVVVGHILFSPVTLPHHPSLALMGLAPMAVHPQHQRQGIGGALVKAGLAACREMGAVAVIVLGHPEYYPRFGFVPASRFGIVCPYEVPDEVFLALELTPDVLIDAGGTLQYHAAFGDL